MDKTLTALYMDASTGQQVVEALLDAGFSGDDISLLVRHSSSVYPTLPESEVSVSEGAGFGALIGTLVGIGSVLLPGIAPSLGGGPLVMAVTAGIGAAAGALTGGIAARLVDLGLDEEQARYFAETLHSGGAVVRVTTSIEWLEWAERILNRYEPLTVE